MRTIRRLVEETRRSSCAITNARSKPRRPNPDDDSAEPTAQNAQTDGEGRVGGERFGKPETADGTKAPRELKIHTRLVEKFGYSYDCGVFAQAVGAGWTPTTQQRMQATHIQGNDEWRR